MGTTPAVPEALVTVSPRQLYREGAISFPLCMQGGKARTGETASPGPWLAAARGSGSRDPPGPAGYSAEECLHEKLGSTTLETVPSNARAAAEVE